MEKIRKIIKLEYSGPVDEQGRPHGTGTMIYKVEPEADDSFEGKEDLRYKGEFVHGMRHGEGDLHTLGLAYNPVSEYEWYSEGEYDSCGRFIHPANPPGSYERCVKCWYPYFEGTWQDDMPLKSRWDNDIDKVGMTYVRNTSKEAVSELPFERH